MTLKHIYRADPARDLILERVVDVPVALLWEAWTTPEHLVKWFAPRPWTTTDCEIDLRPGGAFRSTMHSPDGQAFPGVSCYLEVVPQQKLVWTETMEPGFRLKPQGPDDLGLTAVLLFEPQGKAKAKYTALALHPSAASREKHEAMGFHEGWGTCLDQLVEWAQGR